MSLHIEFYMSKEEEWVGPRPVIEIMEQRFESEAAAIMWVDELQSFFGFSEADVSIIRDVIKNATDEYVGTDAELRDESGNYTKYGLSIEGQFNKKTFDKRLEPVIVDRVIFLSGGNFRLEGRDYKGKFVWQDIVTNKNGVDIRFDLEAHVWK